MNQSRSNNKTQINGKERTHTHTQNQIDGEKESTDGRLQWLIEGIK